MADDPINNILMALPKKRPDPAPAPDLLAAARAVVAAWTEPHAMTFDHIGSMVESMDALRAAIKEADRG